MTSSISPAAARLHREAIVWDNHACMPFRLDSRWMEQLEGHRAAGATFVSLNIGDAEVPFETQLAMAGHFRAWIEAHSDGYMLADSAASILEAKATGKLAVAFDVEGARAVGNDLSRIDTLYAEGVRWMALVYNRKNLVGGGVHDDDDPGLSAFGQSLIEKLERTGITICCSHTGYRTAHDVFDVATKPVIFSHSNARAIHDHPRNIPDDLIRRCAVAGGVVGINGIRNFLGGQDRPVERFIAHVEHVAAVAGPEHVGIGLDYVFDKEDMDAQLLAARHMWPEGYGYEPGGGYLEPAALPRLTDALLARGWDEGDITAFLGGNFLRVAKATWA